jgi:membrane associated rhomboid family serine protease
VTPEEYLAERKRTMRRRSWWAIGIGAAIILLHLVLFSLFIYVDEFKSALEGEVLSWKLLFRSIFFILGLFAVVGGIWGLREAKKLTFEDLIPTPEAIAFAQQATAVTPYYSYIYVGCFVAVVLAQLNVGLDESVEIAGLISENVLGKGELWRMLTSGAMHYGFLHIYFNSQAFYGFGSLIENLSNRAHLSIVFVISVVGGSILSLLLMPDARSLGASGGIMGLIGYLAIYGYRRKQQLPPDFLRSLLINIGFIAAFGLVAYQIVNNAAHFGGLVTGAIYGFLQIPRDLDKDPRKVSAVADALGLICLGVFIFISILTILLMLGTIKF